MREGSQVGLHIAAFLLARILNPPAQRRIVVVRPCIDDEVSHVIVGLERRRLRISSKGELQDRHPGQAKALA